MTQVTFADLGLAQPILDTVTASGYTEPTPVQAAAIPLLLQRRDVMASAATGTGKTAAFMLPALNMLTEKSEKPGRGPRILVLSPTRELAAQIKAAAETYGKQLRHAKVVSIVGGMPYPLQIKLLSNPFEILVATPGRLIDLMDRGRIDLSRLEMLVLDEADRMLDLGFRDDIAIIAEKLPKERVTALFSATLDGEITKIGQSLLNEPERIEIAPPPRREEQILEKLHYADDIGHKTRLLDRILEDDAVGQAIIFTATKIDAGDLADRLLGQGMKAAALHGDMPQRERNRTLARLKQGEVDVLVATDVAARGIDVAGITHVVNFDLPKFAEDYVHRIGRTGRAGRDGIAISFAARHEVPALRRIEKFIGRKLNPFQMEGLEARFEPRAGSGMGSGGNKRPGGRDGRDGRPNKFADAGRPGNGGPKKPWGDRPAGNREGFGQREGGFGQREGFGNREGAGNRDGFAKREGFGNRDNAGNRGGFGQREANGNRGDNFGNREGFGNRSSFGGAPRDDSFGNRTRRGPVERKVFGRDDNFGNRAPRVNRADFKGLETDSTVYAEQPRLTLHSQFDNKGKGGNRGGKPADGNRANGNRGGNSAPKRQAPRTTGFGHPDFE